MSHPPTEPHSPSGEIADVRSGPAGEELGSGGSIFQAISLGLLALVLCIALMLALWSCDDDADSNALATASDSPELTDDATGASDDGTGDATEDGDGADGSADLGGSDGDLGADTANDTADAGGLGDDDNEGTDGNGDGDGDSFLPGDGGSDDGDDTSATGSDVDAGNDVGDDVADTSDGGDDEGGSDDAGDQTGEAQTALVDAALIGDRVVLTGTVGDIATRMALIDAARTEFAPRTVDNQLEVDIAVARSSQTGTLTLTGEVATNTRRQALAIAADSVAASATLALDNALTVAPAGTAVSVAGEVTDLFVADPVQFESGESVIGEASRPTLDRAAALLLGAPDIRVEIGGHTDDRGTAEKNRTLSRQRADAVQSYLVQAGVAADQLLARGYGPANPVAPNDTPEGRAKNRRIEVTPL